MIYVKSGLSFQSFISMCSYCVLWFNNQELEPVQVGFVFSGMINRNWTIPTVFILSALAKLKFHMKCFRLRQITGGWVCIQFLIKTWSILVDLHLTCQEFLQLGNCKSFCTIFYLENKKKKKIPFIYCVLRYIYRALVFKQKFHICFQVWKSIFFPSFWECGALYFSPMMYDLHGGTVRTNQWARCAQWIIRGLKLPQDILTQGELCMKISILLNIHQHDFWIMENYQFCNPFFIP